MNAFGPVPSEAEAEALLDFTRDLDIKLLDAVVHTVMMPPSHRQQEYCNQVLMRLKEHPDAWTRVDAVLEFSTSQQTKFFALSVLEHTIKTRWKMLPPDQREAIKEYIVGLVIKMSTSDETLVAERAFVSKLNQILVEILKQEWPHNWPNFIPEIVGASKTNETLCQNNMVILKLLSEEVFDFSSGQMTKVKARRLKDTMNDQFSEVFQLCMFVAENTQKPALILATLETLQRFLTWIPLGYMFETNLIDTLIFQFFPVALFRNVTLQCLTEMASIKMETGQYDDQLLRLFTNTMQQLKQMLPLNTDMNAAYRSGGSDEQAFVQALSLFLTGFLREHGKLLEARPEFHPVLLEAHHYLVMISDVEETEIFKICLEYWNVLTESLYNESPATVSTNVYASFAFPAQSQAANRRDLYAAVLSKVRLVMITHMVKPEEVLIVETESGEIVREFMPAHTDTLNQYKTMRETLVYLTHLDCVDTKNIMTDKLHKQVDKSEWSWKNLNTLCWAIGSISGAMSEEDEKGFLVTVIKYLLGLCEMKRGKDNKAVIASNIMYIVGQYPRFLRAHWKFLKTVVYKLFEFMHETHEGVQDMACDTFIKIAQKCRRYFVILQVGESMPFIDEIIQTMTTIICDLQAHQVHTFYEAVGYMISAQTDRAVRERLIQNFMALPNAAWDDIINRTAQDVATLQNPETIKHLTNILKTNVAACTSIGHPFVIQLGKIYLDLLNLYKCISEMISNTIARNGEQVTKTQLIRSQRVVKKETLKLIETWVTKSEDAKLVVDNFLPPLLEAVLGDYARNIPQAREPEVLSLMTAIIKKLQTNVTDQVPVIFDATFEVTLDMINKDLAEYPEHRTQFFSMLEAINQYCFPAFFAIPAAQFQLVIDSMVWAMKHTMRNVNETGLTILHEMLINVSSSSAAQEFYKTFFLNLMEHVFAVLSDPAHQSGFKQICDILALMVSLVELGSIQVPLWDPAQVTDPNMTNPTFVRQYLANLLQTAFPNLQPQQVQIIVEKLFLEYKDLPTFRTSLQDFLVQIKVFGEDEVYLNEERLQLEREKQTRETKLAAIPGMVNPYAADQSMAD